MKKKFCLLEDHLKLSRIINNRSKKYLIYSTYFKKKMKKKGIFQYKLNLNNILINKDFIDKIKEKYIIFLSES